MVGTLLRCAITFMPNKKAFAAFNRATAVWGRATLLDETSKVRAIVDMGANSVDIAFIIQWLVLQMYLVAPARGASRTLPPGMH